ncbi:MULTISPECIES: hypothetical protein [unclassified Acinetobacter]|uniref:hypothetical protein n=1 Tax=unclassified Acinetobacter TaxID=196816 RepID=UPI00244763C7|nr:MULTISPECIES: hypothetical protein [unclassified Acinetobacter]MDH0031358.1 hypothetical protein [Acinetobacter sp. GD04021]MDH0887157.1 hypothetical protein [Acinetobacter sp. GD03873]MDH1083554.1 hypothetical protein [Acinetobacter sp. GD03983]MDH2190473.1 hypothetical protein [Acinetobacter sp. GD03645]MDH2204081.1 hypothetical protein [Acinetobacter sp. GD03647]
MKERPILFSTEMVKALLDGRKTQTRRIVKGFSPEAIHFSVGSDQDANCPFGKIGDQLWVRESFGTKIRNVGGTPHESFAYIATNSNEPVKWKPAIQMSRSACRLVLEITNIRVERLQDISEEAATAEGMIADDDYCAEEYFSMFWNKRYGWAEKGWNANPWVWVVEFKVIQGGKP